MKEEGGDPGKTQVKIEYRECPWTFSQGERWKVTLEALRRRKSSVDDALKGQ
jgi:hypothetical protein